MVFEFAAENRPSTPKRADDVSMKRLIDEEISKDANARHTSPGVVGRLMGLDSLPSSGAHSKHRYMRSHAHMTSACSSHDRYDSSQDIQHRRSTDEMPDVKDVFEVMEATRIKVRRSPRSKNGNVTSRFDTSENTDLDFIRQKFMDAKRLSTTESLHNSEELNETLDALVSNEGLLLEFLQKLDPIVRRDLHDPASPASTANCITILKPSRRNQFIGTDNIDSQGTETFSRKQKEVKHSTRKPHAKISSQSIIEDSGSLRQKLPGSCHQEINDKRVSPTRIVVLKPSLEKAQATEGSFSRTHAMPHSNYRRHKTSQDTSVWSPFTEESMYQVSLGDSEILSHITKGSREIARDITRKMRTARDSGSKKKTIKSNTSTLVSDEWSQCMSSHTKLKTSEALHTSPERCDGWVSSGSDRHVTETSVSKEAKKHLSNRWKMTRQYQHQAAENNGFGVLGDMFALSDQESSPVATQTISWQKCPKGELHRDRMPGSSNNPVGISSNDGWRDADTSNVTRSKNVSSSINHGVHKSSNRKRTGRHNEFSMLKDVLKVGTHDSEYACRSRERKSLIRGLTFHGDEADLVSPSNEERMMVEREIHVTSEKPADVIAMPDSSEQTLTHTMEPGHELDTICYLDTSFAVLEENNKHVCAATLNQQMQQRPLTALEFRRLLVPSLNNSVIQAEGIEHLDDDYSDVCYPPTGSESPLGIDHHEYADNQPSWHSRTGSKSPVSCNSDDQPSPVSVLDSSVDAEEVYSGDFEKVSADLQGLRMQLRLLKMEATDDAEGTNLSIVDDDEIASTSQPLPEMEISSAFRDEEEMYFSYVLDMLVLLGINAADQDELLHMCFFSEYPADPYSYDILENKYSTLILWSSSERKLLFDLTNAAIEDIVSAMVHCGSIRRLRRFSSWWDQECFIEEVWQIVVKIRQESEHAKDGLMMDLEWLGSEDGIDLVGIDMGEMILEDLVEETMLEFLGVTLSREYYG